MNSKVAILFLALCSVYSGALSRLEKRQLDNIVPEECRAAIDLTQLPGLALPALCSDVNTNQTQLCRFCTGPLCPTLTGDNEEVCSRLFYEGCQTLGVNVSECQTTAPTTDQCIATLDFSELLMAGLPALCLDRVNTPLVDLCRNCTGTSCGFLTGATAADCRQLFYLGCRAVGVTATECSSATATECSSATATECSSATALVTVKGVLTVVLLVAAFLIF